MKRKIEAIVSGRVQGVWFRGSTKYQADSLRIDGSAVNLADGTVKVDAYGEAEDIQSLIEWLKTGPELARVDNLTIKELDPGPPFPAGFRTG